MSILTINAGSSSLRLSLFEQQGAVLALLAEQHYDVADNFNPSLLEAFAASAEAGKITLVVHRVVHGGTRFTTPCLIDAEVEAEIERLIPLAPLHNPPALAWIRTARGLLGEQVPQVAVFDTAFYRSLPEVATDYALPRELCQRHGIRRYGFHGIAHRAMWQRWREIRPEVKNGGRVISLQLGSGCSITAIDQGVPVDTSMGFSPLEGLVMATRSGDFDPAIVVFLQREAGLNSEQIERMLNHQSGLRGVSGISGDMRVLLESGSTGARLAIDLYCYRIRKYIGAYSMVLGGIDAILFGGGVGENSPQVRARILQGMAWLGVELDSTNNESGIGGEHCITAAQSRAEVWVIAVDEASVMVREALAVVSGG